MSSRETVRCRACERVHLQVPREELAGEDLEQYQRCNRCGSRDGFVQSPLLDEELLGALPACVAPETPQEAGIATGLYALSDEEVTRRIREQGGTR